ncbi:ABC transporter permease [Salinicoccus roseus]|uniref:ABC transporter permease n=1 Tax=Salinicoccus roseus TaxID=45670 RepID=UPI003DA0B9A4
MTERLFRERMNADIERRSYYGKFIFNSHFLIFLTIASGFFLYSLLSLVQTLEPSLWQDIAAALLVSVTIVPAYRTLLKRADGVFLLPYEAKFDKYMISADRYSLTLGLAKPAIGGIVAALLLTVGHGVVEIAVFIAAGIIFYVMNYHIKKTAIHSELSNAAVIAGMMLLSFVSLLLILQHLLWAIPAVAAVYMVMGYMKKRRHDQLDWSTLIDYEEAQLNRYYQNVALFTNVSHIDKQFKRRRYLDPFLWKPKGDAFGKERMYEYLFYRTFARDHDLPMIVLRLILLFGIVMVWIGNLYLSVIIVLFGIYIIVLQMSQIYTAQAYLLWPKVWPVDRRFIQKSYVTYSHKLVFVIAVIFSFIFLAVHIEYFYLVLLFPLWGYIINRTLSRTVYKKEQQLSD